jgi:hypothetical protein
MSNDYKDFIDKIKFIVENDIRIPTDNLSIMKKLHNRFHHTIPNKLYHYKSALDTILKDGSIKDYTLEEIKNDSIYLNNPKKYNDPFDALIPIDNTVYKEISQIMMKSELIQTINNVLTSNYKHLSITNNRIIELIQLIKLKNYEKFYNELKKNDFDFSVSFNHIFNYLKVVRKNDIHVLNTFQLIENDIENMYIESYKNEIKLRSFITNRNLNVTVNPHII